MYQKHVDVHQRHYQQIFNKYPGVTAVDVNYRQKDGKVTKELCIQIYVKEKKPEHELPRDQILPKEIEKCSTDVIQEVKLLKDVEVPSVAPAASGQSL